MHSSGLGAWFDHHLYSFVASLGRVFRKPWATLLTIGVMAVALALPLGLWVVLSNMQRFAGEVQTSRHISVYLKDGTDAARANAVAAGLRARAEVAAVDVRSPDQGLAQLRERDGLGEAIDALAATGGSNAGGANTGGSNTVNANPLPWLLVVTPRGDDLLLAQSLRALPEADLVQHDAQWRTRLDNWLRFGGRVALVLAGLFGLGARSAIHAAVSNASASAPAARPYQTPR